MKKTKLIILVIIIVIGGVMVYRFFNGDTGRLRETRGAVYNYLINEKGYKESEIESVRAEYSWLDEKRNAYMGIVIFKDEPENEYLYIYNKEEGVRERGTNTSIGKHN